MSTFTNQYDTSDSGTLVLRACAPELVKFSPPGFEIHVFGMGQAPNALNSIGFYPFAIWTLKIPTFLHYHPPIFPFWPHVPQYIFFISSNISFFPPLPLLPCPLVNLFHYSSILSFTSQFPLFPTTLSFLLFLLPSFSTSPLLHPPLLCYFHVSFIVSSYLPLPPPFLCFPYYLY